MNQDVAHATWYKVVLPMPVLRLCLDTWDQLTPEQRQQNHDDYEKVCALIDKEKR